VKVLKSAVMDFYDIDTLVEAKIRLLDDVNLMGFIEKLPHIPKRRGDANRLAQEVDDIFALIQFVDEHGQISKLPRYVSSGPDNMPSIRLFEGDMNFLLARLDKLEVSLAGFGSAIAAITAELHDIRHASSSSQVLSTCLQLQANQQPTTVNTANSTGSQSTSDALGKTTTYSFNNNNPVISSKPSWAERVSTPYVGSNSRRPLSNQPYNMMSQGESTDDQALFTEVRSRNKRRRPPSNEKNSDEAQGQAHQQPDRRQRVRPLLVGKMRNGSPSTGFSAARQENQFIRKSIFYIGNVEQSVTVEKMRAFVSSLSVEVVSLFETKPRQIRRSVKSSIGLKDNPSVSEDKSITKAFRLCINKDHCNRLLVESKWPAYVSISEWFFKSAGQIKPPGDSNANSASIGGGDSGANADAGDENTSMVMDGSVDAADETIVMNDHNQGPSGQLVSSSPS
jgi:hypothetical protein